jgi:hypothetical protein
MRQSDQAVNAARGVVNALHVSRMHCGGRSAESLNMPSRRTVRAEVSMNPPNVHAHRNDLDETICEGKGNCATRNVNLTAGPGFDDLTGLGSTRNRSGPVMAKF